jgi:hypothetical protein
VLGVFVHYLRFGPKVVKEDEKTQGDGR